jgi:hypothetical protein
MAPCLWIIVVLVNFNLLAAQGKAFFQPLDRGFSLIALPASVQFTPTNISSVETHRPINRINDLIGSIHGGLDVRPYADGIEDTTTGRPQLAIFVTPRASME